MSKAKLVGMICKEQLQMLEENHPLFGIKKVLTPYSILTFKTNRYITRLLTETGVLLSAKKPVSRGMS